MAGAIGEPPANGEEDVDLQQILNLLAARRRLILVIMALALGAGVLYALRATPMYEATTSVRIDEDRSNLPVLDILKTLSSGSQVETEMQVLRSRTVAEDVVDELALQVEVLSPKRIPRSRVLARVTASRATSKAEYRFRREGKSGFTVADAATGQRLGTYAVGEPIALEGTVLVLAAGAMLHDEIRIRVRTFEEAVERMQKAVRVTRPVRDASIVEVEFRGPDPELVRDIPNLIAARFIEQREQIRKTEARSTVIFLREQLDTLAVQLAVAEDELRAYREGEQIVSLEAEASAHVTRLADMHAQRNALDAERSALARLLDDVRRSGRAEPGGQSPYRRLIAFPSLFRNQAASEMLRSLAEIENERAQLLNRRTAQDPDVRVLTDRVAELEQQLQTIAVTYLEGLTNQVASLDATLARFGSQLERIPAKEIQHARLKRQAGVLEEIFMLLQSRLKEAEIAQAVEDVSVRVVDPAVTPLKPIKPNKRLNVVLAAFLGLVMGVGAAFTREQMDRSIRTREELQALTQVPVLGMIPRIRGLEGRSGRVLARAGAGDPGRSRLIAERDPRSPVSEAYRSLRTNITFVGLEAAARALIVTSPTPGDGKSTTTANLAITLAQQGIRVLLVDGDMRRGTVDNAFTVPREPGLSDVLLGTVALDTAVRQVTLGTNVSLDLLTRGTPPPNPAELLGSVRMQVLVERLTKQYDLVLFDTPPLTVVTDAAVLGRTTDGVLIVARSGVTFKAAMRHSIDQLRNVRARIFGTVLNDVDLERDTGYHGGYHTYGEYFSDEAVPANTDGESRPKSRARNRKSA